MELKGPKIKKYIKQYAVPPGKKIQLKKYHTCLAQQEQLGKMSEDKAKSFLKGMLEKDRAALAEAQDIFAASRQYGMLIILQGMDAAGKDGTIRHVMSGVNPQGCAVRSFKVPGEEDHAHDFLWRYTKVLPERGMIGIFNRSYYEDVLVVRVHPDRMELLPEKIGPGAAGFWEGRFRDINAFEKHLARNGTLVLKFYLNISKDEQKRRLLDRLSHREKYWKFSFSDLTERQCWDEYIHAYEEMLSATSTEHAPWFIVPADDKLLARTFIADVITSAVRGLKLKYPDVSGDQEQQLMTAKEQLESE